MTINMNDTHLVSIAHIRDFLKISSQISFQGTSKKEKYAWMEEVLNRFGYFWLKKKDKSIVKQYLMKMTGFSDAQTGKLIKRKKMFGCIRLSSTRRHSFPAVYTPKDIALIIKTDHSHSRLSGKATKRIFEREFSVFGKKEYEKLKNISVSHIYNLRATRQYQSRQLHYEKTKPTPVNIGKRIKPQPLGKPGFIRVDSVHQGDWEKEKGVYHINLVDEVTQWEIVGCVEKISEQYLAPLLEDLIRQYPFKIINFHSDNGSEYINKTVARLLNKLVIQQTKSRPRQCNDNALAESKNCSTVRKHMGYAHISRKNARPINDFYERCFNIYLNFHRPCGFAEVKIDFKGKQRKVYNQYLTPYEKLKSLENASQYLKEETTFELLDRIAYEKSDNEYAALMQKKKEALFNNFKR